MKKLSVYIILAACLLGLITPGLASAQTPDLGDAYLRAKVVKVLEAGQTLIDGQKRDYQKLELIILNGEEKGKKITVENGLNFVINQAQKAAPGETLVLVKPKTNASESGEAYYIIDKYRVPELVTAALIFFLVAIFFGKKRGATAVLGLAFTIGVLFLIIIPAIVAGKNPLAVCVAGAGLIALLSLYISHGFNQRTSIALVSTLASLALALVIDYSFVWFAKLAGNGAEEAFYLQFGTVDINLQGLLLGGIIIGVLGVLDDVTTGQSAAVEEIHLANPTLSARELYKRGISVGREHIASLINTLALAYVGASFPVLLLYTTNQTQPWWAVLNSAFIAEEIIRTLVGSLVLVVAVPLTTLLAAHQYGRKSKIDIA